MDFSKFKAAITAHWAHMVRHDLYRVAADRDELWEAYLAGFPEGSNPVFRERTEHDCSCCRHFVKTVGDVVAIVDGTVTSLWDVEVAEPAYQAVADAMAALVRSRPIENVFLHGETHVGTDKSYEESDTIVRTWEHFHVLVPRQPNQGRSYYLAKDAIPTRLGEKRASHDVLLRGLSELTTDALDTVLEIIGQNSLYRGEEHRAAISAFRDLKRAFDLLDADRRDVFVWQQVEKVPPSVARMRNTAIGTLLIDLSDGADLEQAVRKFETQIMAPANYRRPTSLVSQRMVDDARAAVESLGLTSALERRHARLSDISVNDILFADRSARKVMRDGAFEGVANRANSAQDLDRVEAVPIEMFIQEILPRISSVEVMLENRHQGNLVSLIAPQDPASSRLFRWRNGFSWAYSGDVADSILERVKRAGGNVTGDLCCRLAWHNYDDLDLHMREPKGGHIYFRDKVSRVTSGQLDVDMNAGHGETREPVENISYGSRHPMVEGTYVLAVNQFQRRESTDVGFEAEIDWLGEVTRFAYDRAVIGTVQVAKMQYSRSGGLLILESLSLSAASRTVWGLKTQDFHRVTVMMLSPNHWHGEDGSGNRHYLFMLDGCVNDDSPRGFFNEFLLPELDRHRKVLEIVGGKMRVAPSADQLSGLGFSDTKRAEVLVRVKGSFTRTLKLMI